MFLDVISQTPVQDWGRYKKFAFILFLTQKKRIYKSCNEGDGAAFARCNAFEVEQQLFRDRALTMSTVWDVKVQKTRKVKISRSPMTGAEIKQKVLQNEHKSIEKTRK